MVRISYVKEAAQEQWKEWEKKLVFAPPITDKSEELPKERSILDGEDFFFFPWAASSTVKKRRGGQENKTLVHN